MSEGQMQPVREDKSFISAYSVSLFRTEREEQGREKGHRSINEHKQTGNITFK